MRQYTDSEKRTLGKVVCNLCGRELRLEQGILKEGVFSGDTRWGYFADRDGEHHRFDLCEACYERLIRQFKVPVSVEEETELL